MMDSQKFSEILDEYEKFDKEQNKDKEQEYLNHIRENYPQINPEESLENFKLELKTTGAVVLLYLKLLYLDGIKFNIYYQDENPAICIYDNVNVHPEKEFFVFDDGKQKIPISICPFHSTYNHYKEKWLEKMIESNLEGYVLEFTDYFLANNTDIRVLNDMKQTILNSNVLEKVVSKIELGIKPELGIKLKENLMKFL